MAVLCLALVAVMWTQSTTDAAAASLPQPTGVRVLAGEDGVLCVWNAVSATDVTGYRVERAVDPRGPWRLAGTCVQARFVDRVSTARPLYYRVKVVRRNRRLAGVSAAVRTSQIPVPVGLRIVAGETTSACTWAAVPDGLVTGYVVERSESSSGPWTCSAGRPPARWEDGSAGGRALWYRVRAVAGGEVTGAPGASAQAVPVAIPQGLTAIAGDGVTVCAWAAALRRLKPPRTWSSARRSSAGRGSWSGRRRGAPFEDVAPLVGPAYYRVRAVSAAGVAGPACAPCAVIDDPRALGSRGVEGGRRRRCAPGAPRPGWPSRYRVERAIEPSGPYVDGRRYERDDVPDVARGRKRGVLPRARDVRRRARACRPSPSRRCGSPFRRGLSVTAGDMRNSVTWSSAGESVSALRRSSGRRRPTGHGPRVATVTGHGLRRPDRCRAGLVLPGPRRRLRSASRASRRTPVANSLVRMSARRVGRRWRPAGRERTDEPDVPGGRVLRADHRRASSERRSARRRARSSRSHRSTSSRRVAPLLVPAEVVVRYRVPDDYFNAAETITRGTDWMSLDESHGAWVPVPTTIDATASTLSASMPHFSEWRGAMQPHGTSLTLVAVELLQRRLPHDRAP